MKKKLRNLLIGNLIILILVAIVGGITWKYEVTEYQVKEKELKGTTSSPSGEGSATIKSDLYDVDGASGNGKTTILNVWINGDDQIVVLWKTENKGYKPVSSATINGNQYTVTEGFVSFVIYDVNGNVLQTHNDSGYYYFAVPINDQAEIDVNFTISLSTSAGGHNVDNATIIFTGNALQVRNRYDQESEVDLLQSKNNIGLGEVVTVTNTPKNGYVLDGFPRTIPQAQIMLKLFIVMVLQREKILLNLILQLEKD